MACLTAKQNINLQTVCFVYNKEILESINYLRDEHKSSYVKYLDNIIYPQKLLVQEIFKLITVPKAVNVETFAHGKARLLEYRIEETSELLNKKLASYE